MLSSATQPREKGGSSLEQVPGDAAHIIHDAAVVVRVEKVTKHSHHIGSRRLRLLVLVAKKCRQTRCVESLLLLSLPQRPHDQRCNSFQQLAGRARVEPRALRKSIL